MDSMRTGRKHRGMTRISGYDLLACPSCGQHHTRSRYASVSLHVPQGLTSKDLRTCERCGANHSLDEFLVIGFIDKAQMTPPPTIPWPLRMVREFKRVLANSDGNKTGEQIPPWNLPHLR